MESGAGGKISQEALLQKERGCNKSTPTTKNAFGQSVYKFHCNSQKSYKIGGKIASNRLALFNNKVATIWLNLLIESVKIKTIEMVDSFQASCTLFIN